MSAALPPFPRRVISYGGTVGVPTSPRDLSVASNSVRFCLRRRITMNPAKSATRTTPTPAPTPAPMAVVLVPPPWLGSRVFKAEGEAVFGFGEDVGEDDAVDDSLIVL